VKKNMSVFKAENIKLKEKITELENRLVNVAGTFKIFSSGMQNHEHEMNNQIANLIANAKTELKIVSPYISDEYVLLLQDRAKNKIKIQIILNDRRLWDQKLAKNYDTLKTTPGVDLVNNPNVKYTLIWTPEVALYTSGALDKNTLMKTVLIGTIVQEKVKLDELKGIIKEMLPTFMR
jgi:phosphatidylserine/phosphatidylglycerophosphate/cardiolipin synthase-like enzyme